MSPTSLNQITNRTKVLFFSSVRVRVGEKDKIGKKSMTLTERERESRADSCLPRVYTQFSSYNPVNSRNGVIKTKSIGPFIVSVNICTKYTDINFKRWGGY